jgi:DNA-binding NtrC family response regulator
MNKFKTRKPTLLMIDDDVDFTSDFLMLLDEHFNCISATNGALGLKALRENNIDVILLDLMFKDGPNGEEILKQIKAVESDIPVIMITDYASVDTVVEAMKAGAYDYVSKTPNLKELLIKIQNSINISNLKKKTQTLQKENSKYFYQIIGSGKEVQKLKSKILLFADNLNTVLITGESGVGKELVARQIHLNSKVKNEPFIAVNCAAIPKDLIESELFGHEKGAFTGAIKQKLGKFELASPGTIFLDEISELNLDAQVKLLRVIQNREFERVGGTKTIESKARIIAATNKNLEELISEGKFREDLFYRLDVLPIEVPPLRKRKEDIPELVEFFTEKICIDLKINRKSFSPEAIAILQRYNWPGNIRELQNHITRAIISSASDVIRKFDLDSKLSAGDSVYKYGINKIPETWEEMNFMRKEATDKVSREIEKLFLENLLKNFDGNIAKAAQSIGLNRSSLYKMLNKCGLIYRN